MAVMMVMGNANLFPKLLGKSESIASVIALEMGTAVYGSPHYHALYAAGLVLVLLLLVINLGIHMLRRRLLEENLPWKTEKFMDAAQVFLVSAAEEEIAKEQETVRQGGKKV